MHITYSNEWLIARLTASNFRATENELRTKLVQLSLWANTTYKILSFEALLSSMDDAVSHWFQLSTMVLCSNIQRFNFPITHTHTHTHPEYRLGLIRLNAAEKEGERDFIECKTIGLARNNELSINDNIFLWKKKWDLKMGEWKEE